MTLMRLHGEGDFHVVVIHCTSFLSAVYQPLAAAMGDAYTVWGLDLPGHGTAANVHNMPSCCASIGIGAGTGTTSNAHHQVDLSAAAKAACVQALVQYVVDAITAAGLWGCLALGHSAGGCLALLAESQNPGLFRALYCYEPVISTPASHDFIVEAKAAAGFVTDGQRLAQMSRKRRATFTSRAAARQNFCTKQPFSRMDPAALELFVQHGLVEQEGAKVGAAQQLGGPLAIQQQQQQQPLRSADCMLRGQQQQDDMQDSTGVEPAVRLVCTPECEAAYFTVLEPPPALQPQRVRCPVLMAVSAPQVCTPGDAVAQLSSHQGLVAWLHQYSNKPQASRQLHGMLRPLGIEVAAALPNAELVEFQDTGHMAPLDKPQLVAASCVRFFVAAAPVGAGATRPGQLKGLRLHHSSKL